MLVPEAFEEHPLRVPRQVAAATGAPLDEVLRRFDELFNGTAWRAEGLPCCDLTPNDVFRYAADAGVSAYMFVGSRLERVQECRNRHDKAIVFAYWSGHVYFYNGAGPLARDAAQKVVRPSERSSSAAGPMPRHALTKSCKHPPKSVEEFAEFPGHLELADVPAGSYWVPSQFSREEVAIDQSIESVLERFLRSGRFPRVSKLNQVRTRVAQAV